MSNIENQNVVGENNEKLEVTNSEIINQSSSEGLPTETVEQVKEPAKEPSSEKASDETAPKVEHPIELSEEEKARIAAEAKKRAEEKQKQFDADFSKIKKAFEKGETIEAKVTNRIKGGLRLMYNDIPLFLPTSHFGIKRNPSEEELTAIIGSNLQVHIHEISEDEDKRKTIISPVRSCIARNLHVTLTTAPGAGNSRTFIISVNGTEDSFGDSVSCTISDSNTSCSDTSGRRTVDINNTVSIKAKTTTSPSNADALYGWECYP